MVVLAIFLMQAMNNLRSGRVNVLVEIADRLSPGGVIC